MKKANRILSIDPGFRNCGWALYKDGIMTLDTIVTKKRSNERFIGTCYIVYDIIKQIYNLCRDNRVKLVLIEQQGGRVHYVVQVFIGMLTQMLLYKKIAFEFIHPRSLGTIENNFRLPSKDSRAAMVIEEFGIDTKNTLHATDAAFLTLHYLRRKH